MPDEFDLIIDRAAPIVIGATGIDAIKQNIRIIIETLAYSVPLDCAFAHVGDFIDSPSPLETARMVGVMAEAIETHEPRVLVDKISMEAASTTDAMQGSLRPRITFHLKEGVTL